MSTSEITRAGVRTILREHDDRVEFVDHHLPGAPRVIDVILFELTCGDRDDLAALAELTGEPVAVVGMISPFRWDLSARALQLGARASVTPGVSGADLVDLIVSLVPEASRGPSAVAKVVERGHLAAVATW